MHRPMEMDDIQTSINIYFFNNIDVFKVTKFPLTENDNNKKTKLPLKQQP